MCCSTSVKCRSLDELLKMSLVPITCQECQLSADGSIRSESADWLLDLKDEKPVWSRLLDINTTGFKRRLLLSMTEKYDIEVEGRLWSLWGSKKKLRSKHEISKSYMAMTVMALCAAKVINLNSWSTMLMDVISDNGRQYFKESFSKAKCHCKPFKLEDLLTESSFEGIQFSVHLKTVDKGYLYSSPLECQKNLAFALLHFFDCYHFGLLECCNRVLGFGYIGGRQNVYFMYDAQSSNAPIFPPNISAPYLLRTNHLQVLLYCLVVALNVRRIPACFCLHNADIVVEYACDSKVSDETITSASGEPVHPHIIPSELWKPSCEQLVASESVTNALSRLIAFSTVSKEDKTKHESKPFRTLYRRKIHNISEQEVEEGVIKPLVDADRKSDEELQIKKDFVRMICSETALPQTAMDMPKKTKDFSCNLEDALFMGPETCLMFEDL